MSFARARRLALLSLLTLGTLVFVLGCGRRRTVVVQGGVAPTSEFFVINESNYQICYVNFSPTTDPNWGPDRLGPTEIIYPGQSRGWRVPPDTYDFRLLDCNQRTMMERRGEPIGSNQRRTVTFRVPEW